MIRRVAARIGCTEGQAMTIVLGLVLGLVTAMWGIPPVLRDRTSAAAAAPPIRAGRPTPGLAPPLIAASVPATDALAPEVPGSTGVEQGPAAAGEPAPEAPPRFGTVGLFARVTEPVTPEGIAVASDGTVWVAGDDKVLHYDAGGVLQGVVAIAGQPADRLVGVTGLAIEPSGALLATDGSTGRILRLDGTGGQSTVATLFDLPSCGGIVAAPFGCEPGTVDHRPLPRGIVVDAAGVIYVTDARQGTIWLIDATAIPRPIHSDAAYVDAHVLGGVAIDKAGELVFTAGRVYALPVNTLGQAGARRQVADVPTVDGASGVAVDAHGLVYVTLAGANRVLVLAADGTERGRVATTADDPVQLDAPSGIAVAGTRLLVTNRANGAVLSVTF